jgi:hypothetical protein
MLPANHNKNYKLLIDKNVVGIEHILWHKPDKGKSI